LQLPLGAELFGNLKKGEYIVKIACGTDIIEIERIKQSIEDIGEKFLERVYTEQEIKYCESKKNQKYQHYAARFAAKEAAFKAISEQLNDKYAIGWKDVEIMNNFEGKPYLNLKGINLENIESMDLSISHCKEYAVANVTVLLKR
jgi:holo-[acyl-carrier protein] synthase